MTIQISIDPPMCNVIITYRIMMPELNDFIQEMNGRVKRPMIGAYPPETTSSK